MPREDAESDVEDEARLIPARFPATLLLPGADPAIFADAAQAVDQEFIGNSTVKLLKCKSTAIIAERDQGAVSVVEVEGNIDFDWTWEGAVAFCPVSVEDEMTPEDPYFRAGHETAIRWSGEILEVDETSNCIYINLPNSRERPEKGVFFVRPYEFLAGLHKVYHDKRFESIRGNLAARLAATAGGTHPETNPPPSASLPELEDWWKFGWSAIWGPPGTGKTYLSGRQIAAALNDDGERILVVSTTNRATDAIAVSLGKAAREFCPDRLDRGEILRLGKEASLSTFREADLESMLVAVSPDVLHTLQDLSGQLDFFEHHDDRALTRKQLQEVKLLSSDRSRRYFIDSEIRAVVATSFKALTYIESDFVRLMIEKGEAPFTTIFIDEAGLISRAAVAVLSLLASRRVVLVGDSRQLAPISKISRVLPSREKKWIASSGLSHLDNINETPQAVHVLFRQYRMHPDVCDVVSSYQYSDRLISAQETHDRASSIPGALAGFSRRIWYVLDEESTTLDAIRAEPGPANKSRIRPVILDILDKFFEDPEARNSEGLFVSPYRAQAQLVAKYFKQRHLHHWSASTVHSQQGSEAEVVIFDTVSAGSCHWPFEEWKRLINVGLSRAREAVILVASRQEMEEPYMKNLVAKLTPAILSEDPEKSIPSWREVEPGIRGGQSYFTINAPEDTMGYQIAQRRQMHPVLSRDQQRLSDLELDGRARLVKGVVGSGKSLVLSHWLAKTAARTMNHPDYKIWAVYANRSLHSLHQQGVEEAWQIQKQTGDFPWQKVELIHINDVLEGIFAGEAFSTADYGFDYNAAARQYLLSVDINILPARCDALFIDESQDIGQFALELLLALVRADPRQTESRPAHIFYDSAQNLYDQKPPVWSDLGISPSRIDLMTESFRSTRPILEFAFNVADRLPHRTESPELDELLELGLLERTARNGNQWLTAHFNQVSGAAPEFHCFADEEEEMAAMGRDLIYLITVEYLQPSDICLIYNNQAVADSMMDHLAPLLAGIEVELSIQTRQNFMRRANTVIATTSHSFKGHGTEAVLIPCVDRFVANGKILANNLFVAMTRARSHLAVYSSYSSFPMTGHINHAFRDCITTRDGAG